MINPKGIAFYQDLVDELRKAEIEPLLTLYHWDLPVWAEEEGGWKNPRIIEYYLEFVKAVVDALSDRVRYWMTFNEPSVFIVMAYVMGSFAPFKQDVDSYPVYLRNMLIAHDYFKHQGFQR